MSEAHQPEGDPVPELTPHEELLSSICQDTVYRADTRFMEALNDSSDERLLFQTTNFHGIEVDQIRFDIHPDKRYPKRGEIDPLAQWDQMILRQPTELSQMLYSGHEALGDLPDYIISLLPEQTEDDDANKRDLSQLHLALYSSRVAIISFDPDKTEAAAVQSQSMKDAEASEQDMIERLREVFGEDGHKAGVRRVFDELTEIFGEDEIDEVDQDMQEMFDDEESYEDDDSDRFIVKPWFVELDTNPRPLLSLIRTYVADADLKAQVNHYGAIGHEGEDDSGNGKAA